MHFFDSPFEALTASVIHREKGECLGEWQTIGASMQKFNVRIHLSKDRAENHFADCFLRNWPLYKESGAPCQ